MTGELESLGQQYTVALEAYLKAPGEETLRPAGELGTRATEQGLGILAALALHEKALAPLATVATTNNSAGTSVSAGSSAPANDFLHGFLAPLDLKFRNALQAQAELDRSNQMVQEQRDRIEAVNKELESFRYSVSHDLRAPLRAIDGFSAILEEEYSKALDEEGRHYLEIVRSSARRLGQLIEDLLLLVRVGRGELSRQSFNISDLAREVANELQLKEPGRKVVFDLQEGRTADGDPRLLRMVLENLLGNAWKFTAKTAEPRVEFGMEERPDGAVYFVRDNGIGFNMDYAGRLFTPFQRLHAETDFPGTGIGLAVVRRIIERHGGRVWTEAAVDRGATFFFTLPPARSRTAT